MRQLITDDSELSEQWIDEFLEELSDDLYAISEANRLERLGHKSHRIHYRNNARELLTELNHIIFNGHLSKVETYWNDYYDEIKDL